MILQNVRNFSPNDTYQKTVFKTDNSQEFKHQQQKPESLKSNSIYALISKQEITGLFLSNLKYSWQIYIFLTYVTAEYDGGEGSTVYQCTKGCSKVNLHVYVHFLLHIYVVYVSSVINHNLENIK